MTDAEYAAELKRDIRHLQAELKAPEASDRTPPAPDPISVHAVLRTMELVKGVDMQRLRTEVLPHDRCGLLQAGPGRVECDVYDLTCAEGVVVTVI